MLGRRLLYPFGGSLFVHLAVILFLFDALPPASTSPHSASFVAVLMPVAQSRPHGLDGLERRWLPAPDGGGAKSIVDSATVSARGTDQFLPGVGVYEAGELDGGITLESGPSIEPEYGFADDVLGSVNISVLVTSDGKAAMVWYAPSDLDLAAIMYMTNALRVAKFSLPRKGGFPVYGIFRIRVEVGSLVSGGER